MKNKFLVIVIVAVCLPFVAKAVEEKIKLPYEKRQSFVVVQGYDSPPTHIKKDAYAIDFSQNGCDAYGKLAIAASSGRVLLAQEYGYDGGYGTQILVDDGGDIVSRYAHLIPGTISVANGDPITQGEPLGEIGNTGLVAGDACAIHPGTHIHFAMYGENSDGSFTAFKPEPISNYENITEGNWYLSDNELALGTLSGLTAEIGNVTQSLTGSVQNQEKYSSAENISSPPPVQSPSSEISGNTTTPSSSPILPEAQVATTTTPTATTSTASSPVLFLPAGGGVSVTPSAAPSAPRISESDGNSGSGTSIFPSQSSGGQAPQATTSLATATATFNSSTLAIDLSWTSTVSSTITYEVFLANASSTTSSTLITTTTSTSFSYPLSQSDFHVSEQFAIVASNDSGDLSTIESIPVELPDWATIVQPIDTENSNGSWYSDNWYDLGTGFYGDIRSLTLEGAIDNSSYFKSHLYLDEYLDPNYTDLNQTFTISNNAPFTDGMRKITIGNLDIRLQPNKYYRLRTYQDYQNRSVILAGTSATGTAMWNVYIYGVGRTEYTYSFSPYLSAIMIPNYPPLAPPNPPSNITTSFDSLNSILNFSWGVATDPDTTSSLLIYQWNISTSTSLDSAQWRSVGEEFSAAVPVIFGNSYNIAVRAIDDLGNISQPTVQAWNFPVGYTTAPSQLDHSASLSDARVQSITFSAKTTVSGIALWTYSNGGAYCCSETFVSIHADANGVPGDEIASSSPVRIGSYFTVPGEREYGFGTPPTLASGKYWFMVEYGPTILNGLQLYGSATDSYAGGEWLGSSGQDAYFRIAQ